VTQATPAASIVLDGAPMRLWALDAGLACCAVEYASATLLLEQLHDELGVPVEQYADPEVADVLVVSGTVTHVLAPSVVAMYERMSAPAFVVSFGACAGTGGPYWDSYAVLDGIDRLLPVDVYVPGCPPSPAALVEGLRLLLAGAPASATARGQLP
jgi:NADH-quinone oxidoreductase subunit B